MIAPDWRASRALLQTIAALALAVSATTAFAQTNLLQNGSFESSSFTDSTAVSQGIGYASPQPNGSAANATIPSWAWTAGAYNPSTFALNQTGGTLGVPAEDGNYSVSFGTGSSQSGGSISQSFAVTSGAQCTLSFWIRRIGGGQGIGANVQVTDNANGGAQVTLTDSGNVSYAGGYTVPIPGTANQWSQVVLKFTAPSTSLKFTFTDTTGLSAADSTDLGLDNVSLTAKTLQTLTIEGTDVAGGTIDPNTDCSRDGDVTWLPAYAANRSHPWGNILGTTGWISRVADMASAPTTTNSNPETLDFRIRFYAPSDISNAQLKYQINPDNYGDIFLNGTKLNATTITGGGGVDATATITNANIVAGLNTIIVRLTDTGGLLGINYRVDLQGYGSTSFQRLVAPPAVTNLTSGLANGSYKAGTVVPIQVTFTDAVTVTGTPTLTLSDGGTASYASGSGTTTLTFNYTVQAGQNSAHLDYASTSALALGGGTIISSAADAQAANLILPSPGASGSLSANTMLVIDTTAPVLNVPANISTASTSSSGAVVSFSASATDNFSTPTISFSQASGSTFPVGTTTVTVTATDAAGNTTTGSFTVTVNPIVPVNTISAPVLSVPANISVTATSAAGAVATFSSAATSSVSSEVFRRSTTTGEHWGSYAVTFTPTLSGNYKIAFNVIAGGPTGDNSILVDAVKLTSGSTTLFSDGFETPTYNANSGAGISPGNTGILGNWQFTNSGGILNWSPPSWGLDPSSSNPGWSLGSADGTRQYAFLQAVSNTLPKMKSVQSIALVAGQVYTISFDQGSRYDFGGTTTYTVTLETTETDPVTASPLTSGSTFPVGTTPVTLTATNSAGGITTGSFNVAVNKATAAIAFTTPAYTYDGNPKPATATTSPSGLPVTFTYDGGSASAPVNAGTHSVAAVVNQSWITGSANGSLTINPAAASVTISNTTQSYDGTPKPVTVATTPSGLTTTVTYNNSPTAPSSVGSYSVVATVSDSNYSGTNTATLQIKDTTPPVLSLPANITAEATSATGATVAFTATATDNLDGSLPVTLTPASGSMFPLGTNTVTATATDHAGNTVTGSFTVTVRDTTPPVISVTSGADFTENFNGYTNYIPYVPQYQSGLANGYSGTLPGWTAAGLHAVHAVDLDGQGNWAVMIWQDNVITSTRTSAANASGVDYVVHFNAGPAVSATPSQATTAADGLLVQILRADNSVLKSFSYQPGAWAGAPTLVPVSFHYTGDGGGVVHLQVGPLVPNDGHFGGAIDDISITPSTPADITLEATSASGAVATWGAAAYDLVSGTVPVTASTPSGSTFALGTTTVTLTATDAANNTATTNFHVIVHDSTAPTLTVPTNIVQDATSAAGAVVTFAATASDAVTASPTISYSQDSGTTFPLGTTTVTVTATDAAGNPSTGSFTVTVNPAAANITLTTPGYTYDGTPKLATATANYNVPVSFTYDGGSTAPTAAGTYAVVATVNQSWIAGTANGTLTISPAPLSVTAAPETKVYGSADPALAVAVTSGTLFGADSLSGALVRAPGENVGNYAIGQGSMTAGANYALTYIGAALTITPKPASVTPAAATKVYGAADPALTGTLSGFLPSDNVTAAYTRTAGENVAGGPYTISATLSPVGVLSNYAITPSTAAFTITPATLAVTANAPTKVYGSADPALTYGATGFQFADNAASVLSGGLKRAPGETVAGGPYAITAGTLKSNSNYTIAFTGNTLTITPATLAVTASAQTKVYGSADPALTYAVNGLQFSDTAAGVLTGALTRVAGETVVGSPYAIQQGTLAANTNYALAYTGANLTITAATPTISVTGYTGTYDGKVHGATGSATGVNGADLSSLLALGATFTNVPGGTANWTFHDPAGNYVDQHGNVAITLTQAAATIVVTPYSVTYDGKSHTATGTATGVNNESLAGLVLTATTHTNAGIYSDAWTFSDANGNYANAGATVTDTIAKAPVTITLAPLAQMYDGTPKPVTATTVETPTVSNLTVAISYNGGATAPTLPGSYTVLATVVDPNYAGSLSATETIGITALVRHAISLDGEIDGSIQVLLPENDTLNGEAMISGDLLVPGTPTVRTNGHPTYGSTVDYAGNSAPSNYTVTLNGKAILRHVDRRVDALTLPIVAAPPIPTGKRNVTVDEHNPNPGDFSTINNLTVHLDDRATLTIPAGTYGKLTIDGGGTVVLGVAGATTPAVYNLQGFAANGDSRIQIAGPVIITVATGIQLNGGLGNSAHPEWLALQIASGGVTLNGETSFYGYIVAPAASATGRNNGDDDSSEDGKGAGTSGTVIINGNASVTGGVAADRLVINGHGLLSQRGVVPTKSGGDRD